MHSGLVYTRHALERMRQRRISRDDVEYCLAHFDTRYTDAKGNPIYKASLPDGRRIKVVMAAEAKGPLVITAAPVE